MKGLYEGKTRIDTIRDIEFVINHKTQETENLVEECANILKRVHNKELTLHKTNLNSKTIKYGTHAIIDDYGVVEFYILIKRANDNDIVYIRVADYRIQEGYGTIYISNRLKEYNNFDLLIEDINKELNGLLKFEISKEEILEKSNGIDFKEKYDDFIVCNIKNNTANYINTDIVRGILQDMDKNIKTKYKLDKEVIIHRGLKQYNPFEKIYITNSDDDMFIITVKDILNRKEIILSWDICIESNFKSLDEGISEVTKISNAQKLRVWHNPQIGTGANFYIPVDSPEEGYKVMKLLGCYDMFQLNHNIKPDYCNASGLEYYDEEEGEWYDWHSELGEDINEYARENNLKCKDVWDNCK